MLVTNGKRFALTAVLVMLLAGTMLAPSLANAAAGQTVDCVVGYASAIQQVVLTVGSQPGAGYVGADEAFCSGLIEMGTWIGLDPRADWTSLDFLCQINYGVTRSVDVYAVPNGVSHAFGDQRGLDGEATHGADVVY